MITKEEETFEYLSLKSLDVDADNINFGNQMPGGTSIVSGDTDTDTDYSPTIKNLGNAEIDILISGTPLVGDNFNISTEKIAYRFDDGIYLNLTESDNKIYVNISVEQNNKIDLILNVPSATPNGSYSGKISVNAE